WSRFDQSRGLLPDKHTQTVHSLGNRGFQGRDTGKGQVELGFGARDIEIGPPPGFEQSVCKLHSLTLIFCILARYCKLVLGTAEFKVVASHLRQETDEHITTGGFCGLDVSCAGLDGTTHTSKKIYLPRGVKSGMV